MQLQKTYEVVPDGPRVTDHPTRHTLKKHTKDPPDGDKHAGNVPFDSCEKVPENTNDEHP